jgi:2-polyprenyl-3-methyl-5-hydroxy-6-metoxy-1,4-benzoquinol methylase
MTVQNKSEEVKMFDRIVEERGEYDVILDKDYHTFFTTSKLDKIENCNILDAGCGSGIITEKIASFSSTNKLFAVDLSPKMIEHVNTKKIPNLTAIIGDLENERLFEEKFFDVVICFGVLHHFPDIGQVVRNISKWLKPNGTLICYEPNGSNPLNFISNKILLKMLLLINKKFVLNNDLASVNETHHTIATYHKQFNSNKLRIVKISPILDYHIHPGKINGLKIITFCKYVVYKISSILPVNSGSSIIIIAKNT